MIRDESTDDKADDDVTTEEEADRWSRRLAELDDSPPEPWDDFPGPIERETPIGSFRAAMREMAEQSMMWGYE